MSAKVIVTGGLGVLGRAVERAFRECGGEVVLIDRSSVPDGTENCIGGVDLTDPLQAADAFRRASERLGGCDVLVNVAGGFVFQSTVDGDPGAWRNMFAANLETCLNMCRAASHELPEGAAIVNIGAAAAERAGAGMGAYAASKSAVARLTECLAAELKGRVRVNAVLPLILDTPQNRADMPKVDPKSWTSPAAVADAIVFLASDGARGINGALIPVTAAS